MKFDCGLTPSERAHQRFIARKREKERDFKWTSWFAWFPVRVGYRDCRWLEWVERRDSNLYKDYRGSIVEFCYYRKYWEYRVIE